MRRNRRPERLSPLNLEEVLFEAAARSEIVRFVATLGPGQADGAIDLAPERLRPTGVQLPHFADARPCVGTLNSQGEPLFHEQSALLAAGLDLVGKAEIAASSKILSTLSPASFASFVSGPVASLLSGAPLSLFGPFEAGSFVALLDRLAPCHCVCPATILPDLQRAGLLRNDVLASIIAVRRRDGPLLFEGDCPLIDVQALGESRIDVQRITPAKSQPAPISGEVLAPVPPLRQAERSWR